MIAVWFSCGVASAVAAKMTLEKYKDDDVRIVNSPVIEEDSDNLRFKMDVEAWLGVSIETATNDNWPKCSAVEVWDKGKFMSNIYGADCTKKLKKEARYQWEADNKPDWHVLGFTADEVQRFERFKLSECDNVLPVLIEAGITKAECFKIIDRGNIRRPRMYDMGYPNANCIGCVKASSPTYWNLVRENHPEVFASRAKQSREIGCKLTRVKGRRIYLDELKTTDKGYKIKNFDCGVFCEEQAK